MCLKKKRLEDIYTCTHMNGSLLSVHTSEQIGVHVSISIIVLQNVHFVIFFPSIFLHRKGIHTTPGKAAHPCNHASLLFAWDNTALCFWGGRGWGNPSRWQFVKLVCFWLHSTNTLTERQIKRSNVEFYERNSSSLFEAFTWHNVGWGYISCITSLQQG